jgi:hypothetical protein
VWAAGARVPYPQGMSRHRDQVDALVEAYLEQDGASPSPAAFARFALSRGARVRVVHADGDQVWVRVLNDEGIHGYDVDVAADSGPLVWWMDGRHPVTGEPRTLRVTPVLPPA